MFGRVLMGILAFLFFALGLLIIFLSANKELANSLPWDPSMCGLGVALVGISYFFVSLLGRKELYR